MKASTSLRVRAVRGAPSSGGYDDGIGAVSRITTMRTNSPKIRRLLWIMTFCKEEPALKRLAFWAQGKGAIAHPALFVRHEDEDGKGYRLHVDRAVPKGTTLLTVPLPHRVRRTAEVLADESEVHVSERREFEHSASAVIQPEMGQAVAGTAVEHSLTQLVHSLTRGLTDEKHPQHYYLRFLHDHYNPIDEEGEGAGRRFDEYGNLIAAPDGSVPGVCADDADDDFDLAELTSSSSLAELENFQAPPMPDFDPFGGATLTSAMRGNDAAVQHHRSLNAAASREMLGLVDAHSGGTAMIIKGASNAPYLTAEHFDTPRGKAELVRLKRTVRDLQQGLPFFNASAVRWAVSMVMARGVLVPEVPHGGAGSGSMEVFIPHAPSDYTTGFQHIEGGFDPAASAGKDGEARGGSNSPPLPTFALREKSVRQLFTPFTAPAITRGATVASSFSSSSAANSGSAAVGERGGKGNNRKRQQPNEGVGIAAAAGRCGGVRLSTAVEASRLTLVPLLDMANHSADPNAHYCVTLPGREEARRHQAAVAQRLARLRYFRAERRERERRRALRQQMAAADATDGYAAHPHASLSTKGTAAGRALEALTPKAQAPARGGGGSPRMLAPVLGVKGWHYWRPCVHLVTVRDVAKGEEITLKYAEDALLMAARKGGDEDGGNDALTDAAEAVRDGFVFRYGFRPPVTPAEGCGGTARRGARRRHSSSSQQLRVRTHTDVAKELEDILTAMA